MISCILKCLTSSYSKASRGVRSIVPLFFLAPSAPVPAKELPGTGTVTFVGSSTRHDFDGTAVCNRFARMVNEAPGREPQTGPAVLTAPVAAMSTGIERQRTLRARFESELFPLITGRLSAALLKRNNGSEFTLLLQLRNIERSIKARVPRLVDTTESVNVDLGLTLPRATFRRETPTVLGFIRVADAVKVNVKVQLDPLDTPWLP